MLSSSSVSSTSKLLLLRSRLRGPPGASPLPLPCLALLRASPPSAPTLPCIMPSRPSLTSTERNMLLQRALDARSLAYCPYSKFRVGAAILLKSGDIIDGANVENASYGAGICAERTALLKAQTSAPVNHPSRCQTPSSSSASPLAGQIKALAVSSDLPSSPCSPCGICRQFIREFAALDTPIFMVWGEWRPTGEGVEGESERGVGCHDERGVVVRTLEELLPMSFGPEELGKVGA